MDSTQLQGISSVEHMLVPCAPELITIEDPEASSSRKFNKPKTRSAVYNCFTFNYETNHWSCNNCRVTYLHSQANGPSCLHNHMKRKHPNVKLQELETGKNATKTSLFHSKRAKSSEPLSNGQFKDMLVKFVVTSNQPFTLVNEDAFKSLLSLITKNEELTSLPSANTMKSWIFEAYERERLNLKTKIVSNSSKISFSIDCWTSSSQIPFQGVIGTWIDEDWNLINSVLDLTILEGSHTGENIAEAFMDVVKDFESLEKLLAITSDNASNVDKACEFVELAMKDAVSPFVRSQHRIRCFAHILNLACHAILNQSGDLEYWEDSEIDEGSEANPEDSFQMVKKLRKCIVAIRRSPQRRQAFASQCEIVKMDHKNLVRDVRTRWNSTYLMIERAMEMKAPLLLTLSSFKELRSLAITDDEWEKLKKICELLKPFLDATNLVSTAKNPTISEITAVYQVLLEHLEKFMDREMDDSIKAAASKGWDKVIKYYPSCDGDVYVIATVLDPRRKMQWYVDKKWKSDWLSNCRRIIKRVWASKYTPADVTEESALESLSPDFLFDQHNLFGSTGNAPVAKDELQRYLSEPRVNPQLVGSGILSWWRLHESEYPNLSKMARDYLAVLPTSVSVERFFSSGRDLISHRRESLSAETIRACMCLHSWFHANEVNLLK